MAPPVAPASLNPIDLMRQKNEAKKKQLAAQRAIVKANEKKVQQQVSRSHRFKQYAGTAIALVEILWTLAETVFVTYITDVIQKENYLKANNLTGLTTKEIEEEFVETLSTDLAKGLFTFANVAILSTLAALLVGIWMNRPYLLLPYMFFNVFNFVIRVTHLVETFRVLEGHAANAELEMTLIKIVVAWGVIVVKVILWFVMYYVWTGLVSMPGAM